jgi:acyl carrier protein
MIKKIREIISNQLNIPIDKVLPESKIIQDLGADSLDVVELLMELEEEFGITVTDDEAQNLITLTDIEKLIKNK